MHCRQREVEGRTPIDLAFGPDSAAMSADDSLDNG